MKFACGKGSICYANVKVSAPPTKMIWRTSSTASGPPSPEGEGSDNTLTQIPSAI